MADIGACPDAGSGLPVMGQVETGAGTPLSQRGTLPDETTREDTPMTKTKQTPSLEELEEARDRLVNEMTQDLEDFFPIRTTQIVQLRLINQSIDQWFARGAQQ